jgi:hypothetical protein
MLGLHFDPTKPMLPWAARDPDIDCGSEPCRVRGQVSDNPKQERPPAKGGLGVGAHHSAGVQVLARSTMWMQQVVNCSGSFGLAVAS